MPLLIFISFLLRFMLLLMPLAITSLLFCSESAQILVGGILLLMWLIIMLIPLLFFVNVPLNVYYCSCYCCCLCSGY
jgi:hypothetical protein